MTTDDERRLASEAAFHDARFGGGMMRAHQDKYYVAVAHGRAAYEARVEALAAGGRALEIGCGTGGETVRLAGGARSAAGLDISAEAVRQARDAHGARATFVAGNAEATEFADASFDLIFGAGIVHHLDVAAFGAEVSRLLRPGGRAVFWEPLGHNAAFNLYRRLTPAARTPDEHPLLRGDLAALERLVGPVRTRVVGLTTIPAAFLPEGRTRGAYLAGARALDAALLRLPGLRDQAWYALIEAERRGA